jgi:integrase/recombinase XerD
MPFGDPSRRNAHALYEDLNLNAMKFFIRHPKGEGTWGKPQYVSILRGDMVCFLEEFLDDRSKMIAEYGIKSNYLFVNPGTGLPYSENSMRFQKRKVEDLCGIRFQIKEMRPNFASVMVNNNLERLNLVSEQLRHATSETTRKYYAKINRDEAIQNLNLRNV